MVMAYRIFAYLGLASIFGSLLLGFQRAADAPWWHYAANAGLYACFFAPHHVMTRGWYKKALFGSPAGSARERQIYITVSVVTWWIVLLLQFPLPGFFYVEMPYWGHLLGASVFVLSLMLFFQGITFPMIDGLLGVPGSAMGFAHGAEVPLFTEGPYAQVRHPMYRGALLAGLASIVVYPGLAQIFWALLIGGAFVAFIPVEEQQMLAARGQAYLDYKQKTPYRLIRGVW